MKKLVALLFIVSFSSFQTVKKRRIIIKEYPGATILPRKLNEIIFEDLFDQRFIKVKVFSYKGKMHLECYSKDSILLEVGDYTNSLSLLRKQNFAIVAGGGENINVTEYYEPLRNGKWLFYDTLGRLYDSAYYVKGIKQRK